MYEEMRANKLKIEDDRARGSYTGPSTILEIIAQRHGAHARTSKHPKEMLVEVWPENDPDLSGQRVGETIAILQGAGYEVTGLMSDARYLLVTM